MKSNFFPIYRALTSKNMGTRFILSLFTFAMALSGCESEFDPIPFNDSEIVVEGAIEAARSNEPTLPTYVILTKSQPFFREFAGFQNLFVKDAEVWIGNGKDSFALQRICWSELTDTNARRLVAESLNLNLDSLRRDFELCIYVDLVGRMRGETGKTYNLNVKLADGRRITGSTTIPRLVPIDSAEFLKPPGSNNNDTLAQMRAWVKDPKGADFYRYFTSINESAFITGSNSVTDDAFFEGINTKFNLFKSEPRGQTIEQPELFGLWRRGDSISIKFCTIDESSFNFWNTLEQSANRGGPFANYLKTKHNVKGGLGVWCGYGVTYYNARIPKLKK